MKKIGILYGQENTFPPALVERINSMNIDGVTAEAVQLGAVRQSTPSGYAVIIDRISHEIPFYRAYLKTAALYGTYVINNPFWWSADDKFFNNCLAEKVGVAVPRTVLLPSKAHPPRTSDQSMRNLEFPLKWDEIFGHIGFPAFLKPYDGGGWRDVSKVHSAEDFFRQYDSTGTLVMMLQENIDFTEYYRCYGIGRREVKLMRYDPGAPFHERYVKGNPEPSSPELAERLRGDVLKLCNVLGYDLNTVEFAVRDGIPYAIDFMNPAPDCDHFSIGQENFDWVLDAVARFAIEKAQSHQRPVYPTPFESYLHPYGSVGAAASAAVDSVVDAAKKVRAGAKGKGVTGAADAMADAVQPMFDAVSDAVSDVVDDVVAEVKKRRAPVRKPKGA